MDKTVDPYRYVESMTRRITEAWIRREPKHDVPFTPLCKPLAESKVAIISSAGVAMADDEPFDQERERQNPWWGDPSCRVVPASAAETDLGYYHLHVNPKHLKADLDCALPMRRLQELADERVIGRAADEHYTMMGYILRPAELLAKTVPVLVEKLRAAAVDAVVLVPI